MRDRAPNGQIRVLLTDNRSLFREALRTVLDNQGDLRVVAEAAGGDDAVSMAALVRPDVAFVGADLPAPGGVEVTRRIRETVPECRVLLLADAEESTLLLAALEVGVSGFLTKDCPLATFIDSARAVHRGEVIVPPRMLGGLLSNLIHRRRERDDALLRLSGLTPREREVLRLLARGVTNNDIAQELVISPETARTHVNNLLGKLEMNSRFEAASFVLQHGLLDHLAGVEL
ncbi:MAG: response regulator transcription factor [Actinobacteria bacterium]|nr:response regulator transcription factor [Actinomycetota bacterium]